MSAGTYPVEPTPPQARLISINLLGAQVGVSQATVRRLVIGQASPVVYQVSADVPRLGRDS